MVVVLIAVWNFAWFFAERQRIYAGFQPLRYLLTALLIEFLAGALVAHAFSRNPTLFTRWLPWAALGMGLVFFGWRVGANSHWYDRVEILRVASYGVAGMGALILALTLSQTTIAAPRSLVRLGDASYSLYLLHPFLLDIAGIVRFTYLDGSPAARDMFLVALPFLIVALSVTWFLAVERPTIAWSSHWDRQLARAESAPDKPRLSTS